MHVVRNPDTRSSAVHPLPSPSSLRREVPLSATALHTLMCSRDAITSILNGEDDRLVAVVGPCSIHDPASALAYAGRLAALADEVAGSLLIVMRVYVEKPRTRLGWKGLASDPHLDGTQDVNHGLRLARSLMAQILDTGLPVGCEFLDPAVATYLSDVVSWGSIGARTVQSPVHRHLTSGLNMPVGIKNPTSGKIEDAIDAIVAAGHGHVFPGIDDDGMTAVVATSGNPDCHVVLRGGASAPNYGPVDVARTLSLLVAAGLPPRLFIDASHGNSGKDHTRQPGVVDDVAARIAGGEFGIAGMMLESFLEDGRQELVLGRAGALEYGVSITDACAGWASTLGMVERLADAVDARRCGTASELAG
jgi:3-deoxy-7-phosphoheptulonate synthase